MWCRIFERNWRDKFSSFLWFSTLEKYHAYLNHLLWTSASPYFDSVCFRQCRRHWDTLSLINFSHYVQRKLLFWWFKSGVFEPHLGAYSLCERRDPYIKGCNSGASQKILWEQVVTCSGHSKEHFKTNLAEYWGREVHGRSSYLPDYGQCPTTFCYKHTTGY